jgi:hypothetical protein
MFIFIESDKCVCEISNSGGESEDRGADDGELQLLP